jgi:hypothetical protein
VKNLSEVKKKVKDLNENAYKNWKCGGLNTGAASIVQQDLARKAEESSLYWDKVFPILEDPSKTSPDLFDHTPSKMPVSAQARDLSAMEEWVLHALFEDINAMHTNAPAPIPDKLVDALRAIKDSEANDVHKTCQSDVPIYIWSGLSKPHTRVDEVFDPLTDLKTGDLVLLYYDPVGTVPRLGFPEEGRGWEIAQIAKMKRPTDKCPKLLMDVYFLRPSNVKDKKAWAADWMHHTPANPLVTWKLERGKIWADHDVDVGVHAVWGAPINELKGNKKTGSARISLPPSTGRSLEAAIKSVEEHWQITESTETLPAVNWRTPLPTTMVDDDGEAADGTPDGAGEGTIHVPDDDSEDES